MSDDKYGTESMTTKALFDSDSGIGYTPASKGTIVVSFGKGSYHTMGKGKRVSVMFSADTLQEFISRLMEAMAKTFFMPPDFQNPELREIVREALEREGLIPPAQDKGTPKKPANKTAKKGK